MVQEGCGSEATGARYVFVPNVMHNMQKCGLLFFSEVKSNNWIHSFIILPLGRRKEKRKHGLY